MMFRGVCASLSSQGRLLATPCSSNFLFEARGTAHRAAIGKISRKSYIRRFPVTLMRPDGSTIEIRAAEPRGFVQLPVDLRTLTEEERRNRLAARKPKAKQLKEDIIDDNFDVDQYAQLWQGNTNDSKARQASEKPKASLSKIDVKIVRESNTEITLAEKDKKERVEKKAKKKSEEMKTEMKTVENKIESKAIEKKQEGNNVEKSSAEKKMKMKKNS